MARLRNDPPRPQAFLDLENGLTDSLLSEWEPVGDALYDDIIEQVEAKKFNDALDVVENIDYGPTADRKAEALVLFGLAAMLFGAKRAKNTRAPTSFEVEGDQPVQIEQSRVIANATLKGAFNDLQQARAGRMINQQQAEPGSKLRPESVAPARPAKAQQFGPQFKKFMRVGQQDLIRLTASLHISRLAQYGFLAEANSINIAFYEIDEVLDSRTCPVCREMDGKVFPVNSAHSRLIFDLSQGSDNEESLKATSPWPRQDKASVASLKRMGTGDLIQKGLDTPPFHPLCRGILKRTNKTIDAPTQRLPSLGSTGNFLSALLAAGLFSAILPNKPDDDTDITE